MDTQTQTTEELNEKNYADLKKYYARVSTEWANMWNQVEGLANYESNEWGSQWRNRHKDLYDMWKDAHKAESSKLRRVFSDEGGYIPVKNFTKKDPSGTFFDKNRGAIAALTHRDDVMDCSDERGKSWAVQAPRILFIGREANCFGGGLAQALDKDNPVGKEYSWFQMMANGGPTKDRGVTRIAFASYSLLENVDAFKTALESGTDLSPCDFKEYDSENVSKYLEAMRKVAIMNLNKRGGFGGDSAKATLSGNVDHGAYLLRYTPFILAEVKLFNPDIIVFMGPSSNDDWKWFKRMLTDSKLPDGLKLDHDVILCDTFHFSAPDSRDNFVKRILGIPIEPPQIVPSTKTQ